MNTKILVTGATGFIGKHLVTSLGQSCVEFESFQDDLATDYTLEKYDDVFSIIHLAGLAHNKAKSDDHLRQINYFGTLALAKKAKLQGIKRFVFLSSTTVYGNVEGLINEISPTFPFNEFARLKLKTEIDLLQLGDDNFEVVIVRAPLIYGSDAPANFKLLTKLVDFMPILPFQLARKKRSYVAVQSVIDFLLICVEHPKAAQQIFLVADIKPVSICEFTQQIALMLGKKRFQVPIPIVIMKVCANLLGKKELVNVLFGGLEIDISKANELLGWSPKFTMQQAMIKSEK
ncbi:NAD-dependent epimerase/dehydratase family protein [Brumicola pallidula]|uniref:UDP-glucose 4-epimerase n=1 Tax=Brumicola pallidula DSM 14239 = ACAM 615 TaxID=1121922 RepID=K6YAW0_9ALTE|nr:NAD-dependent epimerase/dehydratase family protein [Glaciecola pallidula]GAC29874.1 UDP-glucose 4-epimerase [Glaciecola pallidula DSM 14239 = ACAM 615]